MNVHADIYMLNELTMVAPENIYEITTTNALLCGINNYCMGYANYDDSIRYVFFNNKSIAYDDVFQYITIRDGFRDFPNLANPQGLHGCPWAF